MPVLVSPFLPFFLILILIFMGIVLVINADLRHSRVGSTTIKYTNNNIEKNSNIILGNLFIYIIEIY